MLQSGTKKKTKYEKIKIFFSENKRRKEGTRIYTASTQRNKIKM